jgi:hypothetical protein
MHLDIKDGYHWNHPNDFNCSPMEWEYERKWRYRTLGFPKQKEVKF